MQYLVALAALAGAAVAQSVGISAPPSNAKVSAGSDITVKVSKPNSLSSSEEIGIAIAIGNIDKDPSEVFGDVLYHGPYDPVYHESTQAPYQNFTITIPSSQAKGAARINVAHAALIGAGPEPWLETVTSNITIV
ncbi:hypothetical protein N7468_006664 [Penicillium chermesinum]|uniref:Uncharacterized protein n=1 Tax=Penicillium chermesinum TaxID=63820 RepID=A0A9W9TK19_9EURO|nr:uncharacterized protein N7468_006664 [Penicillium chermesinum]KAJ5225439.1 hypothetical protein N7468_006664 [Penicillium chermesinum]KAJ6161335.1 hypothetical protein N7470_004731 [Penicillium chermesinum]